MSYTPPEFIHDYANSMAPLTRRQMPVFAHVGKGIPGNSFTVELNVDGTDTSLVGTSHDNFTDEDEVEWELKISDLVPVLHYELWTGVRVIDEVLCYVYWYNIKAVITVSGTNVTLWEFATPYVKRFEYTGSSEPPADTKISQG